MNIIKRKWDYDVSQKRGEKTVADYKRMPENWT
jgi:hypothetical protein